MFRWRRLSIPRFYGLNKKTNPSDVKDSLSIDCENTFQRSDGVITKRTGFRLMFSKDEASATRIDEIGAAFIGDTKYYFKFSGGKFWYSTNETGAAVEPAITLNYSAGKQIWWVVLNDRLYFVDGVNKLRFFDPVANAIFNADIYARPTVALTGGGAGTGYDYTYTVDKAVGSAFTGESPACATNLVNKGSAATVTIAGNTGPQTLAAGDTVRIYSRATTVASGFVLVATYVWTGADVIAGTKNIATVAITDALPQLYTEQGEAINQAAPVGLTGITEHYGRIIGWKDEKVYVAKISNPNSFPPEDAVNEAFVYTYGEGDGEPITRCISYLDSLYVMKATKIAVFAGVGPDDTGNNAFAFRRLQTNGIGCIAPKSAHVQGDESNNTNLIFLSREGFYATTGQNPIRIGELIETEIIGLSDSILRLSTSFYHKRDGFYWCFVGTDTSKKCYIFDSKKDEGTRVGWFKLSGLNATCVAWDDEKYIFGTAGGICGFERTNNNSSDYIDIQTEYVAPAAVNTVNNVITVANVYSNEQTVLFRTAGTAPNPLVSGTTYYVIRVSDTEIILATSAANAALGIGIDLTTAGVGSFVLATNKAISAYYTTNWIKFGDSSLVKKVLKPSILLNAGATSINLTMTVAYDWVNSFSDAHQITVQSTNLWGSAIWGSFIWGQGSIAVTKNIAIARRKFRSVRYKFANNEISQGFDLLGIEQEFDFIRNRGNLS
jgi:hypothetical protein